MPHQFSAKGLGLSEFQRTGPIDWTPGTPGSDKYILQNNILRYGYLFPKLHSTVSANQVKVLIDLFNDQYMLAEMPPSVVTDALPLFCENYLCDVIFVVSLRIQSQDILHFIRSVRSCRKSE